MNKKDIELIKECLLVTIERYRYELSTLYDHEANESKILTKKIEAIDNLYDEI